MLSQDSLDELERIYNIFEEKELHIKDLQFMYGADGLPQIADPQEVALGSSDSDFSLDSIVREYKLINSVLGF